MQINIQDFKSIKPHEFKELDLTFTKTAEINRPLKAIYEVKNSGFLEYATFTFYVTNETKFKNMYSIRLRLIYKQKGIEEQSIELYSTPLNTGGQVLAECDYALDFITYILKYNKEMDSENLYPWRIEFGV